MMRRALRRARAGLLLALQLTGVALPLADARLEGGAAPVVHVEERSDRSCDAAHFHDACMLCQQLAQRQMAGDAGSALPATAWTEQSRPHVGAARPATAHAFLERGRSPPTV